MIEDHTLADVRATDDGHDNKWIRTQLRDQFARQRLVPFTFCERWHLQQSTGALQLLQDSLQFDNLYRARGERRPVQSHFSRPGSLLSKRRSGSSLHGHRGLIETEWNRVVADDG